MLYQLKAVAKSYTVLTIFNLRLFFYLQASLPIPVAIDPTVIDLCSPSPVKICALPSLGKMSHAVDEQQQEGLGRTPSPAPNRASVDLCTPGPEQSSPQQSPAEINHLPLLSELLAQDEQPQAEVLEQTPAQRSSHLSPVGISHLSLSELLASDEQPPQGEGLEEEFASLRIETHNVNAERETSPARGNPLTTSLEKQTYVWSILFFVFFFGDTIFLCPISNHTSRILSESQRRDFQSSQYMPMKPWTGYAPLRFS